MKLKTTRHGRNEILHKFYTFEEIKDKHIGKIGTPRRDEYERKVAKALDDYHIGEAIKEARKAKHLTQEQLGELVGVQKAQISRLDHPHPGIQSHGPPPLLRHGRPRENCPLLTTRLLQAKARQLALAYNPPTAWSTAPGAASFSATRCSPSSRYSVGIAFRSYSNCVFTAAWSLAEIHPAGNSSLCACHTSS